LDLDQILIQNLWIRLGFILKSVNRYAIRHCLKFVSLEKERYAK